MAGAAFIASAAGLALPAADAGLTAVANLAEAAACCFPGVGMGARTACRRAGCAGCVVAAFCCPGVGIGSRLHTCRASWKWTAQQQMGRRRQGALVAAR